MSNHTIIRAITRVQDADDYPTTPDTRYLQLSGGTLTSDLYVNGSIRARQSGATRYRSDHVVLAAAATINAYDDTGTAYIPITIDGSTIALRPSADTSKQFTVDASGNIQALGRLGGAWAGLSYGTGWAGFGAGYRQARYKIFGDMVFLAGLAARTSGSGTVIGTLPAGFRPTEIEPYGVLTSSGFGQIDIHTDGTINLVSGGTGYVQLNGVIFSIL